MCTNMSTCETCKHWMGNGTAYIALCGMYGNHTACNHSCATYKPIAPEPPEPMRQYPPTSEPVAAVVVYGYGSPILKCGACGSWYMDAKACLTCGRAWVMP